MVVSGEPLVTPLVVVYLCRWIRIIAAACFGTMPTYMVAAAVDAKLGG